MMQNVTLCKVFAPMPHLLLIYKLYAIDILKKVLIYPEIFLFFFFHPEYCSALTQDGIGD